MLEKMKLALYRACIETIYLAKYNTLKLTSKRKDKNRLKEIDNYIQELAEVRLDLDIMKTREKLTRKQIKEVKEILKEVELQKEELLEENNILKKKIESIDKKGSVKNERNSDNKRKC